MDDSGDVDWNDIMNIAALHFVPIRYISAIIWSQSY